MGVILQFALDTSSMITLLGSLCVGFAGVIAYLYISNRSDLKAKDEIIESVRAAHIEDLKKQDNNKTVEQQIVQDTILKLYEIKTHLENGINAR